MYGASKSVTEGLPMVLALEKGTTYSLYHGNNNGKPDQQ